MCFISFPFLKRLAVEQKIIYYQSFTSNVNSVTLEHEISAPSDPSVEITEDNHSRRPDSFAR
jgi:hypothetical protein